MGFFAIMNPIANTPVFLGLTAEDDPNVRRKIAAKALILSLVIIIIFSAAGKLIFDLFGITLSSFRIMGGILVALVGYHMLQGGEHSPIQHPSQEDKQKCLDDKLEIAKGNQTLEIAKGNQTTTLKTGDHMLQVKAGQSTIEAAKQILLKVGGNSIKIDTQGITISGAKVSIEGKLSAEMKAAQVTVGGNAMLTLKGGLVKIN